jgi:hypothetical protein
MKLLFPDGRPAHFNCPLQALEIEVPIASFPLI